MTQVSENKSRLDLVKEQAQAGTDTRDAERRGRFYAPLSQLRENPANERKTFRNMAGFVESIRAHGVIEPLTVEVQDDGTYQILTGHRRYRAVQQLANESPDDPQWQQLEVIIRDPEEAQQRRRKSLISNVQREEVGPVELAEALQTLLEEDEQVQSQDDLARLVGKNKSWVSRMLRILKLPVESQQKIRNTRKTLPYEAVSEVSRVRDAQKQNELLDELMSGASVQDIRGRVSENRGSSDEEQSEKRPKPKQSYYTNREAAVIVQSKTVEALSNERLIAALENALDQAKAKAAGNGFTNNDDQVPDTGSNGHST